MSDIQLGKGKSNSNPMISVMAQAKAPEESSLPKQHVVKRQHWNQSIVFRLINFILSMAKEEENEVN